MARFNSIFDFCEQVDLRVVNKRVIESLVKAGALDSLGHLRSQLFAVIDKAIEAAQKVQRDRESGQQGLFGLAARRCSRIPTPGTQPRTSQHA